MQFVLGDHLGNNSVTVDDTGSFVNREEWTPHGETTFGSFAKKRFRFNGKERDDESGLDYIGARYYSPGLMRWTSPDPAGAVDGLNLYRFVRATPSASSTRTANSPKTRAELSPIEAEQEVCIPFPERRPAVHRRRSALDRTGW